MTLTPTPTLSMTLTLTLPMTRTRTRTRRVAPRQSDVRRSDVRLSALGLDYQVMAKAAQYTSHGRIMRGATTPLGGLSTDGMFGLRAGWRALRSPIFAHSLVR